MFSFPFAFLILEKVAAVNKYDPPPEVVAAQDHVTHVVNSMTQPQRIFDRYSLGTLWVELRVASTGQPHHFPSPLFCDPCLSHLSEGGDQVFI